MWASAQSAVALRATVQPSGDDPIPHPLEHALDKSNPPTTLGVFKPVGHTLIAFRTADELDAASTALLMLGFAPDSMVRYTPAEMKAQVDLQLLRSSVIANFGYEIDLIKVHGKLADEGCSFLVVEAPSDALADQVADLVRRIKPAAAQHYGRILIEDLTEKPPGRMAEQD